MPNQTDWVNEVQAFYQDLNLLNRGAMNAREFAQLIAKQRWPAPTPEQLQTAIEVAQYLIKTYPKDLPSTKLAWLGMEWDLAMMSNQAEFLNKDTWPPKKEG
ncbi:MAG: hypothetical protein QNK37_08530 [Acidobacteriota bacterium]|nr:hypothetical protein [Acidobacteriota bacterium]